MARKPTERKDDPLAASGQRITEEQLHDVYREGTIDGNIRLENKTIPPAQED